MKAIRRFDDVASFLEASSWLRAREAENDLFVAELVRLEEPSSPAEPYLASTDHPAAVVWAPPRKLFLAGAEEAGRALAEDLLRRANRPTRIVGPKDLAWALASEWTKRTGTEAEVMLRLGAYSLSRVEPPPSPPGRFRAATPADRDRLVEWIHGFHRDTALSDPYDAEEIADRFLCEERVFLWDDEGPRSMAARMASTWTGHRVSLVYTPRELRGRGYAAAVVAALSQHLLDRGARFCCLHTDLENPTSNALYRRLGYEPTGELVELKLE